MKPIECSPGYAETRLNMNHPIDLYPESNRRADPETNTDLKTQNSGAFNQARSNQSQLGYRRIGQLLSNMGFQKAKTHASTYAILWDDNLLSQNTFSGDEKNEK
jgi:hypothetical protein